MLSATYLQKLKWSKTEILKFSMTLLHLQQHNRYTLINVSIHILHKPKGKLFVVLPIDALINVVGTTLPSSDLSFEK